MRINCCLLLALWAGAGCAGMTDFKFDLAVKKDTPDATAKVEVTSKTSRSVAVVNPDDVTEANTAGIVKAFTLELDQDDSQNAPVVETQPAAPPKKR